MRIVGKMDDFLVFEVERGKYIIVNPDEERWAVEWSWYGQLGKWCDTFIKCEEDEKEQKCLKIIEDNKKDILERLNELEGENRVKEQFLKEQEEFYDALEPGKEYDWFDGYA